MDGWGQFFVHYGRRKRSAPERLYCAVTFLNGSVAHAHIKYPSYVRPHFN
jgi:hypothetical protein